MIDRGGVTDAKGAALIPLVIVLVYAWPYITRPSSSVSHRVNWLRHSESSATEESVTLAGQR